MADTHESCFICKRSNPDRHVYYKDYEELEGQLLLLVQQICSATHLHSASVRPLRVQRLHSMGAEHFRHEHYLCEDSICRQEHFQVWPTEAELQQHRVKVHGDNMSRHEKRQAMRIPLDINVSNQLSV